MAQAAKPAIYLDYNASAPVWPEVREAVAHALTLTGNPSAVHGAGRVARRLVEDAREALARFVGAAARSIVFTSGGSEANALAIRGLVEGGLIDRIIVGAVEHPSVLEPARRSGVAVSELAVDCQGIVDLAALRDRIAAGGQRTLVSVMAANNETGVVQPLQAVASLARAAGALVHTDAVQAVGRLPDCRFDTLGVDLLTVSAHKLGGPKGIGALVVGEKLSLAPQLTGGGQELGRRAGTENLPGIAGFGAVARVAERLVTAQPRMAALRARLEGEVKRLAPDAVVFGQAAPRLANTSAIGLPGVAADVQVMALDLEGIAVSAGSACSSGKVARSHVLEAMGAGALAGETIRVSLGPDSTEADIERFVAVWAGLARRRSKPMPATSQTRTAAFTTGVPA